ncbi:MAG: hypothetical protein COW65_00485 [Cytophagales bacterium CG18_big_fil_WC_8_21_14_2_50_42_9]|nr:MAG: hypothetical protein COW65_00485 [Cytophagales bacterium CG18_big_fil_WC_8_21_14_2_50_42_9]
MKHSPKYGVADGNPIYYHNHRVEALEEVYKTLLLMLEEASDRSNLSPEAIEYLKDQFTSVYKERVANLYLNDTLGGIVERINHLMAHACNSSFKDDDKDLPTKVIYYNNKHRLVSNEQY